MKRDEAQGGAALPEVQELTTTVIGADTQIRGEMTFENSAVVNGNFEGKITGQGELHIAESAVCKAEISSGKVIVDGDVQGNIVATERVQLNSKGRIHGDVLAPRMVVADGAVLVGNCVIGDETVKTGKSTLTSAGASPKEATAPATLTAAAAIR